MGCKKQRLCNEATNLLLLLYRHWLATLLRLPKDKHESIGGSIFHT